MFLFEQLSPKGGVRRLDGRVDWIRSGLLDTVSVMDVICVTHVTKVCVCARARERAGIGLAQGLSKYGQQCYYNLIIYMLL